MIKQKGTWVRITYNMGARIENDDNTGWSVTIRNGEDVRVESYDRYERTYVVDLKGVRHVVKADDLESNGPRALHDMLRLK